MLKGRNIYLRTLEPSDADLLISWENDPENWRVSSTVVPFSKHLIMQYVHSAQDLFSIKQIRFIICSNVNDEAIGTIDLFDYEPIHQRLGLGILINKDARNKGVGSEALQLVSDYAVNGIGVRNLYCNILSDNSSSIKLFENAGFIQVGCKKNWFNDKGNWIDEFFYQKELVK